MKNNARAYINPNRRNAEQVALAAIQQYAQLVSEGNAYQGLPVVPLEPEDINRYGW